MNAVVRPATSADVDAVLSVWAAARSTAARTPDNPELVEHLLERDPGALLVAEAGGQVVGALIAGWDGWRGNVYRLAVLPEHRRAGVGRALVEAGHARLGELGAHRVTALVGGEEGAAHRLWRALGYQRDEFVHRFVRNL
ncbi:MAG TPA: GNAT family N-acetyltransferase [Thermoleophilaceae bacterium]|nr:GNAT family N-acetyltransferase [Thermoleophilaceae bacterium]